MNGFGLCACSPSKSLTLAAARGSKSLCCIVATPTPVTSGKITPRHFWIMRNKRPKNIFRAVGGKSLRSGVARADIRLFKLPEYLEGDPHCADNRLIITLSASGLTGDTIVIQSGGENVTEETRKAIGSFLLALMIGLTVQRLLDPEAAPSGKELAAALRLIIGAVHDTAGD